MPEKRRAAALLRLDGRMSYAEIAVAVGTTEGSARVLVHMALKELRSQLADLMDSEDSEQ
jgi:DNA-directed RNA polymerase specialized sigma24 family protein